MKKRIALVLTLYSSIYAQDLKQTVLEVIDTNPVIQERLKNYNATREDITTAQAGYYPSIDLNLGIGYEKTDKSNQPVLPNSSKNFSVYQNSLKYTQNLFNGFGTTYQVKEQKFRTISSAYSYIEKVNGQSFATVDAYLQVMKNQELLKTAEANVKIDQDIFEKVQKLYNAGLTTLSEVNKIESSLALAKSNLVVQENTILDVSFKLQKVLGRNLDPQTMSKPEVKVKLPNTREEAIQFAIKNNPSLLVSDYNIKLAQSTNKQKKSFYYPKIDIEISESMNKNLSAVEGNDDKFRAMAYISYNFFRGFTDKAAIQKSVSKIHQEIESKNNLRRQVIEGLSLSWSANTKLQEQLVHLEEYKKYSLKTLTLYAKEYDLGRRSLLDLLSAQNDFIGSKAQIINTKYSLLYAKYRILDAMGILVRSIAEEDYSIYNNVGLTNIAVEQQDVLPVRYDRDNDLIVNEMDICINSSSKQMKNIYGCELKDASVSQIERYSGFLFDDNELQNSKKLQELIKQLTPYGVKKIKFKLLANAQDDDLNQKELTKLSQIRAEAIQKVLLKSGVLNSNIEIFANGNNAPMYSNSDDRNNRVDIIVMKLK